jgi:methyl-accepting chemotaxis protein
MKMFADMKIGMRLGLGFGLVLALLIACGIFAINRIEYTAGLTSNLYKHPFAVTTAILRVDGNLIRMHRSMKDVVLAKSPEDIDNAVALVNDNEKKVLDDIPVLREGFLGDPRMIDRLNKAIGEWKPIRESVIALVRAGDKDKAGEITKTAGVKALGEIQESIKDIYNFATTKAKSFMLNAEQSRESIFWTLIIVIICSVLVGVLAAYLITRSLLRQIGGEPGYANQTRRQQQHAVCDQGHGCQAFRHHH